MQTLEQVLGTALLSPAALGPQTNWLLSDLLPCSPLPQYTGMLLGARPGAADESVALTSEQSVLVPHELPGQDPEGGSEVNFALDESSSTTATPRGDLSQSASATTFTEQASADGPKSPLAQVWLGRQAPDMLLLAYVYSVALGSTHCPLLCMQSTARQLARCEGQTPMVSVMAFTLLPCVYM